MGRYCEEVHIATGSRNCYEQSGKKNNLQTDSAEELNAFNNYQGAGKRWIRENSIPQNILTMLETLTHNTVPNVKLPLSIMCYMH